MTVPYTSSYDKTIPFSDSTVQLTLEGSDILTYTVPGTAINKYSALFSYASNSNVFVGYNATPAIPTLGSTGTTVRVEFKPLKRYVLGGDVLSFLTPDATAYMGVSLRAIPNPSI